MSINNYLKAEKGDPDWIYTPKKYLGKEFKLLDAKSIELEPNQTQTLVLRQNPTEYNLLAKHFKLNIKESSKLDLIITNESSKKTQQIFMYDIILDEGSSLNLGTFLKNGKLNKHIFQIYIKEGAEFNLYGILNNNDGGDTELITKVVQEHPDSHSNQYIVAFAGNQGQTVFQSTAMIDQDSIESESHIECLNLVLEESGTCFSKPEVINIGQNSKSSYSTETSNIDTAILYYMSSRGIPDTKAKELIINGYQRQVLRCLPNRNLENEIVDFLENTN